LLCPVLIHTAFVVDKSQVAQAVAASFASWNDMIPRGTSERHPPTAPKTDLAIATKQSYLVPFAT
jgi:hypothetical protein